jgi:hypothetical protein
MESQIIDCQALDENCPHPWVIYENDDGRCRHKACSGPHPDCGEIVEIVEVGLEVG